MPPCAHNARPVPTRPPTFAPRPMTPAPAPSSPARGSVLPGARSALLLLLLINLFNYIDRQVLADLRSDSAAAEQLWGADPGGTWPTSRSAALRQLDHVLHHVLPHFGPHEDAMLSTAGRTAYEDLAAAAPVGEQRDASDGS